MPQTVTGGEFCSVCHKVSCPGLVTNSRIHPRQNHYDSYSVVWRFSGHGARSFFTIAEGSQLHECAHARVGDGGFVAKYMDDRRAGRSQHFFPSAKYGPGSLMGDDEAVEKHREYCVNPAGGCFGRVGRSGRR